MAAERANKWSNGAFGAACAVTLLLLYEVIAPFLVPVLIAGFVVVIFDPAHERLVRLLRGRRRLAAAISSVAVLGLLLVPAAALAYLLVREGVELVTAARSTFGPSFLDDLAEGRLPAEIAARLETVGIAAQVKRLLSGILGFLTGLLSHLVAATGMLVVHGLLAAVSMYYFFLDGRRLVTEAARISPLEERHQLEFLREFRAVTHTIVHVNLVVAGAQGLCGALGFWLVGLPEPLVWGATMALLSLVPVLGTALVWVPASLVLLATGQDGGALFLLGWGAVVVGSVDNVLRPVLAHGRLRVHPLLVFVTLFGGLAAFGPAGFFLGPLAAAMFTAVLRIWRRDFVPMVNAGPRDVLDAASRASG